jgi:D-glycero-alpha-D-manno-heptose-7-phosphate kinase
MIISRTPFRISFFGGGTDYPAYFEENRGAVLATTIDKYCYISCRYLPPFFPHRLRIVWSLIENVQTPDEIKHPAVRECLRFMKIKKGIEIHHDADLPARAGLGASSAFTVGLLNCLYALSGRMISKMQLAKDAIYVEQELIKENVGCQDQILASFGGFNLIEFDYNRDFRIHPVTLNKNRLDLLCAHLMLIFTGISRDASEISSEIVQKVHQKKTELKAMHEMVYEGIKILNSNCDIKKFGELLHQSWKIKRNLTRKISNPFIDEIYETARKSGAVGGKILGAGGGGFMLLFADPALQPKIKSKLKKLLYVPFKFENLGSQIIFYTPEINSYT